MAQMSQMSAVCVTHHTVSHITITLCHEVIQRRHKKQQPGWWGGDHVSPVGLVIMTLGRARAHWTELLADYDPAQVEPE